MILHPNWTMNEPIKVKTLAKRTQLYYTAEKSIIHINTLQRSKRAVRCGMQPSIDSAERDEITSALRVVSRRKDFASVSLGAVTFVRPRPLLPR